MNHASQPSCMLTINPKPILDMNYAFAQTAMLMAAVRLHIFTYLASNPLTATATALADEVFELYINRCNSEKSSLFRFFCLTCDIV